MMAETYAMLDALGAFLTVAGSLSVGFAAGYWLGRRR